MLKIATSCDGEVLMKASLEASELFEIDGFRLNLDKKILSETDVEAIKHGQWEAGERKLATQILQPSDRVLECGACIGVVYMTIAIIIGSENVFSYVANLVPLELALQNFAENAMPISLKNAILLNCYNRAFLDSNVDFYVNNGAVVSSNMIAGRNKT